MSTRFIAAALLAIGPVVSPLHAQSADAPADNAPAVEPPIIIDSETNQYDLRTGVTRFTDNVSIQRGPMRVSADFGEVHQAEGRITTIELTGEPTTWEDRLDDGTRVTGQAQRIHFDVLENVVTLTGQARIRHEQGEFTGEELTYDLDTENLVGRGSEGNRARVIIESETLQREADSEGGNGSAPAAEPPAQPESADAAGGSSAAPDESSQPAAPSRAGQAAGTPAPDEDGDAEDPPATR